MVAASPRVEFLVEKKMRSFSYGNNPKNVSSPEKLDVSQLKQQAENIFSENTLYQEVKEKLIGATISYRPNLREVIPALLSKLHLDDDMQSILGRNVENLISLMEGYSHYNLRTFQATVYSFKQIYAILGGLDAPHEFWDELLSYCLFTTIRNKSGKDMHDWGNLDHDYIPYDKKLPLRERFYGMSGFKFIDDLVWNSQKDNLYILEVASKYINESQRRAKLDKADPVNQLEYWWNKTDEFINEQIEAVIQKLENNEYDIVLYSGILEKVVSVVAIGFSENFLENIVSKMQTNIESSKEKIYLTGRNRPYSDKEAQLFEEYHTPLAALAESKNEQTKANEINSIFTQENWADAFSEYCYINEHRFQNERRFWANIDVEKVITVIKSGTSEEVHKLKHGINAVYNFSNIDDYYKNDLPNLQAFRDSLTAFGESTFDKIKQYAIKLLLKNINKFIEKLEQKDDTN